MLRVLMATMAGERGGAEAVMDTIARRLPDDVSVVMAAPAGSALLERWRHEGLTVAALPVVTRLRRLDQLWAASRGAAALLSDLHIDVAYTHGITAQIVVGRAARSVGVPVVCHSHDEFNAAWSGDGLLHRAAVRTPRAHTIVVSETVARSLEGRIEAGAVTVVPNGVVSARVEPIAGAGDGPLVVWCGRLQRWKGAHVFLRVAQQVAAVNPSARFAVVGDALFGMEPEYPGEVRALAEVLGLGGVVTFTGHVPDARVWLAAADVVVHSSTRADPFPLVVLEAMMQARVVVAFARGGPAEALDDTCGVLVAPDDVRAMALAIVELLSSEDVRRVRGDAARAKALRLFALEGMVPRITEVLRAVAKKNRHA